MQASKTVGDRSAYGPATWIRHETGRTPLLEEDDPTPSDRTSSSAPRSQMSGTHRYEIFGRIEDECLLLFSLDDDDDSTKSSSISRRAPWKYSSFFAEDGRRPTKTISHADDDAVEEEDDVDSRWDK